MLLCHFYHSTLPFFTVTILLCPSSIHMRSYHHPHPSSPPLPITIIPPPFSHHLSHIWLHMSLSLSLAPPGSLCSLFCFVFLCFHLSPATLCLLTPPFLNLVPTAHDPPPPVGSTHHLPVPISPIPFTLQCLLSLHNSDAGS